MNERSSKKRQRAMVNRKKGVKTGIFFSRLCYYTQDPQFGNNFFSCFGLDNLCLKLTYQYPFIEDHNLVLSRQSTFSPL
jgi:hypothetical protein